MSEEMTKDEVLNKMVEFTHVMWNEDGVRAMIKPFGFNPNDFIQVYEANPKDMKGLTLDDGAESAMGASSWDMAIGLCDKLGIKYEDMYGRGSQVRACVTAIKEHYNEDG